MNEKEQTILHQYHLQMALEVKRICEKHDIPFFLIDGTALGAFYLQDFLPWDDDLDIGMYWPDYLRFIEVSKQELPSEYVLKDFMSDDSFGCSFGQLVNISTTCIQENNAAANDVKGIFIDIHPFCDCSENIFIRRIRYYRFKFYKLCLMQKRNYIQKGGRAEKIFKVFSYFISEESAKQNLWKCRIKKNKTSNMALKIHGRKPDDYIFISNLKKLQKINFAGDEFYIQPDCKRMLDTIYGQFDLSKKEENRHRIISLKI